MTSGEAKHPSAASKWAGQGDDKTTSAGVTQEGCLPSLGRPRRGSFNNDLTFDPHRSQTFSGMKRRHFQIIMALPSQLLHLTQSYEGSTALEPSSEGPSASLLEPAPQEVRIANNPPSLPSGEAHCAF